MRLFSDQIVRMQHSVPNASGDRATGILKSSIDAAYRSIGSRHPWSYLRKRTQINTSAPYSTGTVAYSSSTRQLTLSSGTWPSWAKYGTVIIDSVLYKVSARTSDTVLVLDATRCPTGDIASGTSYQIYRSEYPLPANFSRLNSIVEVGRAWEVQYVPPEDMLTLAYVLYNPTRPYRYTIIGSNQAGQGLFDIVFIPPPASAQTFDIAYEAKPRIRTLYNEATSGTIAISGTDVTGTGTAFTSAMIGCCLRVGDAASIPTDISGKTPSSTEYIIASVESSTALTLTESGTTASGVRYLIDDPVDIDSGDIMNLFDAMCSYEVARMAKADDRDTLYAEMIAAQKLAMGSDSKTNLMHSTGNPIDLYGSSVGVEFSVRG